MYIIKADKEATFKNAIDILDEMTVTAVPPGHYAEVDITDTESMLIQKTEEGGLERIRPMINSPRTKGGAITKAAAEVGLIVGAKFLVTFTQSGDSARRISRLRSPIPILAITPEVGTYNRLASAALWDGHFNRAVGLLMKHGLKDKSSIARPPKLNGTYMGSRRLSGDTRNPGSDWKYVK